MRRNRKRLLLCFGAMQALLAIGYLCATSSINITPSLRVSTPLVADGEESSILCVVMTQTKSTDLQEAIMDTWGPGCADIIFLFANESLTDALLIKRQQSFYSLYLPVEENRKNTWMKV